MAATVTPQHLLWSRNAMFAGGIRPHFFCLPVLKRESHRQALVAAATSGSPKFFLGTDSAPHARHTKENACGCAGCYSAPAALEFYAAAFEDAGALDRLEGFASFFGADFYGLPRHDRHDHAGARDLDAAGRVSVRRAPHRAAGRRRDGPLAACRLSRRAFSADSGAQADAARGTRGPGCYPSREVGRTVAPAFARGRKVRAPQSRMPGNARTP